MCAEKDVDVVNSLTHCHFEHLSCVPPGLLNVLVASAPLLKTHSQAILLTSFLRTAQLAHLFEGTSDFYEKLLCMNAHTAAMLLGEKLTCCTVIIRLFFHSSSSVAFPSSRNVHNNRGVIVRNIFSVTPCFFITVPPA